MYQEKNPIQVGMRFGCWTVIGERVTNEKGTTVLLCRCICGTERLVSEHALKYGDSLSCGCLRKKNTRKTLYQNLTGLVFGELTVVGPAEQPTKEHGSETDDDNTDNLWHCRCSCGNTCDISTTLLITRKRTYCQDQSHDRKRSYIDITGQRFERLTALYPTDRRDSQGKLIWHCRCDCGNEIDLSYNTLMYSKTKSCGCRRKEHDREIPALLTHVAGTSIETLKSQKTPKNNTTGAKGVYLIQGKYVAKIVFQKKAYYLGAYKHIEDAIMARRKGEELLHTGTVEYYERWKKLADADPKWGAENPIRICVEQGASGELRVWFEPDI